MEEIVHCPECNVCVVNDPGIEKEDVDEQKDGDAQKRQLNAASFKAQNECLFHVSLQWNEVRFYYLLPFGRHSL